MSEKYVRVELPGIREAAWGHWVGDSIVTLAKPPWGGGGANSEAVTLEADQARLLAPVEPSKIICVGLNYAEHVKASYSADEAPPEPLLFFKPPSSIIGPGDSIVHPDVSERVDYEAELGVVIGGTASRVSEDEALDYVFGYTCVNDVTARDLQKKDKQWARAKGFDTFCPAGPWIITDLDVSDVLVEGIHNDEIKQSGRASQMIFPIPRLISYISSIMTLLPGDLIATGTPSGIAPMKPGDTVEVRIEGIGSLKNRMA
jgi:2-keto-4-pentenoate hydratase/2-oxohepta-3-ene-1,7-dioic acid hydratase in catechol pathway